MLEVIFNNLLNQIGENPRRQGLEETPVIAAKAFAELTKGYDLQPHLILGKDKIEVPVNYNGTIEIPDIQFMSLCEHTFLPFLGTVDISYEPRGHIVGGGAFALVIEAFSKRLQLQERLNVEIADVLFSVLEPKWVKVQMRARHCCMNGQEMRTQVMRGST
jgi:GTP cyclohydrolase I